MPQFNLSNNEYDSTCLLHEYAGVNRLFFKMLCDPPPEGKNSEQNAYVKGPLRTRWVGVTLATETDGGEDTPLVYRKGYRHF